MRNYRKERKEVEQMFDFITNLECPLLMNALIKHCNSYQIQPSEIKAIDVNKLKFYEEALIYGIYYNIDISSIGLCESKKSECVILW